MKKLLQALILTLAITAPFPAQAQVSVDVHIALPPPILFPAPPELIVLPETYVYVAPDVDVDIFFYNGWWWRPWEGRWYRSRYYNNGWAYYQSVPSFYRGIPRGWRNDYRERRWKGHQWDHQRIPHQQVQGNWKNWERNRHWEKQNTWGVQGLKTRTQSQQPSRKVQTQQPRPQSKDVKAVRTQQHKTEPQSQKAAKPQRKEADPQSRGGQPQGSQKKQGNNGRGK
jgi:hypothetical protein